METIIPALLARVKEKLPPDPTGHDWLHSERVRRTAVFIHKQEDGNRLIIECAALLHDVYDWKFHDDTSSYSIENIRSILEESGLNTIFIEPVLDIIKNISFKGAQTEQPPLSLEGQIVQDADRLDAMGAIGIARAFAYGGFKKRLIYNPDIPPHVHESFEEYRTLQSTTINHFYEKLLLLKDRMNTASGKRLAEQKHRILEDFLKHFIDEWKKTDGQQYKSR